MNDTFTMNAEIVMLRYVFILYTFYKVYTSNTSNK